MRNLLRSETPMYSLIALGRAPAAKTTPSATGSKNPKPAGSRTPLTVFPLERLKAVAHHPKKLADIRPLCMPLEPREAGPVEAET